MAIQVEGRAFSKSDKDNYYVVFFTLIILILLSIYLIWVINNNSFAGMQDILSVCLGTEGGLLGSFVALLKFEPTKRFFRRLQQYCLMLLCAMALGMAGYGLKLVVDRVNSQCVAKTSIFEKVIKDVNDRECDSLAYLQYINRPVEYEEIIENAKQCRNAIAVQTLDALHVSPVCRTCYINALDSLHEDIFTRQCLRLRKLSDISTEMSMILDEGKVLAVAPFLAKYHIPVQALIFRRESGAFLYVNKIRGFLKDAIQLHLRIQLQPIWRSDRTGNPREQDIIEFILIKNKLS